MPRAPEKPMKVCPRCGGSGTVPIIERRAFAEDGVWRPDLPQQGCDRCGTAGYIPDDDDAPRPRAGKRA